MVGAKGTACCSACGSEDVRRVSLIHESGTRRLDAEASGTTIGLVGDELAVGSTTTAITGSDQTLLARRLTPPERRDETAGGRATFGCLGVVLATIMLGAIGDTAGLVGFLALAALWVAGFKNGGPFIHEENARWNAHEYPRLMAAWKRSVLCMRCGAVTDPESLPHQGTRRPSTPHRAP